jgi:hypothetical protein
MNTQQLSSIARQGLAILGIVFGVLTQSVTSLHLPAAVSSILVIAGSVILAIEHYVGDPSTGSTPTPAPVVQATTPAPVSTPQTPIV